MSQALQFQKLKDLQFIESQNNNPSFTWNGNTYYFNPSITEFKRDLEISGFEIVRLMTATVRLYGIDDCNNLTSLFPNGTPQPQNKITYTLDNTQYRIETIKFEKTGAYFRLVAHSVSKTK